MSTDLKTVKVAYSEFPPFVEIRREGGTDIPGGFMPEIVREVAKWMELEVQWIREPEDNYGTWENNTWTGMCGMLFRKEVDLIVNPLLPSDDYAAVAFFTNPIIYEAFTIMSGKQKQDGGFFLYFSVLQPMVWCMVGATLVIVALTSSVLYFRVVRDPVSWIGAMFEYFWVYFAYMLQQAPNPKWVLRDQKRRFCKILQVLMPLLVTLWVLGVSFLIMTVFQTLLVSKLTIVRFKPVVDSMEQLLDLKHVVGRAPREIALEEVLKGSGIPVYEKTWIKLEPELVGIDDMFTVEAFEDLEDGKICFIHGKLILRSVIADYFREHGRCSYHVSENEFFPFPLLMALQKSLPDEFKRKFNYGFVVNLFKFN